MATVYAIVQKRFGLSNFTHLNNGY